MMATGRLILPVVAAAILIAFPAVAACPESMPVKHTLETFWGGLSEEHLIGFAYLLSDPSVQTGKAEILCRSISDETSGGTCPPQAGSASDGLITVNGDWATESATGCPNAERVAGRPIVVTAASASGEGTPGHRGQALVVSVEYDPAIGGYDLAWAHPGAADDSGLAPLLASDLPVPNISQVRPAGASEVLIDLAWDSIPTHDDCERENSTTCPDSPGGRPTLAGYTAYVHRSPCPSPPVSSLISSGLWTPIATADSTALVGAQIADPGEECLFFAIGLALEGGYATPVVSGHSPGVDGKELAARIAAATGETTQPEGEGVDLPPEVERDASVNPDPADSKPAARDVDFDGIADGSDTCLVIPNPGQEDRDGDGWGDACDNCPVFPNADQADGDADGIGDTCEQRIFEARIVKDEESWYLEWSTTREDDLEGFEIRVVDSVDQEIPIRKDAIACTECASGLGANYRIRLQGREAGWRIRVLPLRSAAAEGDGVIVERKPGSKTQEEQRPPPKETSPTQSPTKVISS